MRMGMSELLIVFAILVLLFGAKRLPQLADGMGKAIRNFKRGLSTDDDELVGPPPKQVEENSSAAEIVQQAGQVVDEPVAPPPKQVVDSSSPTEIGQQTAGQAADQKS